MKKILISLFLATLALCAFGATSNYWPHVTATAYGHPVMPKNYGVALGQSAYVVGANVAAVEGSIAIGDGDGVSYVLDAVNAVQIGEGVNSTDNSLQFRDQIIAIAGVDASTGETGVTVAESGAVVKQAVLTVVDVELIIDGSAAAGWGAAKLGTLPEGRIIILGVTVDGMAITADGGDLASGEGGDFSLGTTATSDNTIDGTDVNLCPSTSLDPIQTGTDAALAAEAQFDGTSTAVPIYANFLIDDGDVAALSTNDIDCVVTVTYINLGDY